jgi:predicted NBD/HSP70 family sugar kinase
LPYLREMPFPLKLNDNHRRIAMLIRQHQPVTRASLAKLAGLGSGPITQVTRDLVLAGLVKEGERIKGGRGQPALPLMLDPSGTLSFGVGMIPGRLRIVAIDFAGEVIDEELAPASSNGPESIVAIVRASIDRICRKARLIDPDRILGVGFAVPGFFFADHAHVRTVDEHSTWRAENLQAMFSSELGLQCWVENDATAAAIAEYYRANAAPQSLITLLINYGIGAGLVLDGRAYRGRFGNAGEIGAFFPLDKPRPSGTDLLKFMREWGIGVESLDQVNLDDRKHEAAANAWAAQSSRQLRELVHSAWSWFDPERIVLSGALPQPVLTQLLKQAELDRMFAQDPDRPKPETMVSQIGANVSAIGAAHLPIHAFTCEAGF